MFFILKCTKYVPHNINEVKHFRKEKQNNLEYNVKLEYKKNFVINRNLSAIDLNS